MQKLCIVVCLEKSFATEQKSSCLFSILCKNTCTADSDNFLKTETLELFDKIKAVKFCFVDV